MQLYLKLDLITVVLSCTDKYEKFKRLFWKFKIASLYVIKLIYMIDLNGFIGFQKKG